MVDTVKISDLNGLTSVAAEDLFVVVDQTGPTTNSITRANLVSSLGTQLIRSDVDATFSGTKTGSGMLELTNTSAQSTSISALWLSGAQGALMMDNLAHKRIFWNDGGGAFGLRSGHYYSGGEKYITSGDGAAEIEINTDTTNGSISFRTAQTGNSGDIVSWDNETLMSILQTQFGQRVIPSTDKTLDLGLSTRYWNNFYTANAFVSGNVGIGTTSPLSNFHVVGTNQTTAALDDGGSQDGLLRISGTGTAGGTGGGILFSSTQGDSAGSVGMAAIKSLLAAGTANTTGHLAFSTRANSSDTSLTERMRITSGGNIGIGTSNPTHALHIVRDGAAILIAQANTTAAASLYLGDTDVVGAGRIQYANSVDAMQIFTNSNEAIRINSVGNMGVGDTSPSERLSVNGNLTVSGSVSKGSGSFKIDHPLPEMTNTHHLVHSFIEGPQADLIYRGKTNLVNGVAEINIDEVAGMTLGTFEILCREVQCFTSNETGWIPVRGYVIGNLLKIESQVQCDDEVSWLVIGERQDPVIYESSLTDDFGKIIVEPEKKIVQEDLIEE